MTCVCADYRVLTGNRKQSDPRFAKEAGDVLKDTIGREEGSKKRAIDLIITEINKKIGKTDVKKLESFFSENTKQYFRDVLNKLNDEGVIEVYNHHIFCAETEYQKQIGRSKYPREKLYKIVGLT